jgi:hypothetical protein
MKVRHTRESDFETIELDYPDAQYQLAEKIHSAIQSPWPLIFDDNGKKIFVGYQHPDPNLSRVDGELGVGKYKITIEKII